MLWLLLAPKTKPAVAKSKTCNHVMLYSSVLPSIFSYVHVVLAQYTFSTEFSLMWEWGRARSLDVFIGSTQTTPSQYALALARGGHWHRLLGAG